MTFERGKGCNSVCTFVLAKECKDKYRPFQIMMLYCSLFTNFKPQMLPSSEMHHTYVDVLQLLPDEEQNWQKDVTFSWSIIALY